MKPNAGEKKGKALTGKRPIREVEMGPEETQREPRGAAF